MKLRTPLAALAVAVTLAVAVANSFGNGAKTAVGV